MGFDSKEMSRVLSTIWRKRILFQYFFSRAKISFLVEILKTAWIELNATSCIVFAGDG